MSEGVEIKSDYMMLVLVDVGPSVLLDSHEILASSTKVDLRGSIIKECTLA